MHIVQYLCIFVLNTVLRPCILSGLAVCTVVVLSIRDISHHTIRYKHILDTRIFPPVRTTCLIVTRDLCMLWVLGINRGLCMALQRYFFFFLKLITYNPYPKVFVKD